MTCLFKYPLNNLSISFLVPIVNDPATLLNFARDLQSSRDPGVLYRRFTSNVESLETSHLIGPGMAPYAEFQIRKIVSETVYPRF